MQLRHDRLFIENYTRWNQNLNTPPSNGGPGLVILLLQYTNCADFKMSANFMPILCLIFPIDLLTYPY
jgi:hypothetical protein